MSDSNDELMMETMYWWGIPTLFRCEHNKNLSECDIALAGVPHSTGNGTTERDQHLGPRAVRHVSAGLRRVHLDYNINPWKRKKIFDLGDVALPHANNNERCIKDITDFYSKIAHANPTYVIDDVVHYCVANMPGGVPMTSTLALNAATLPFVLNLAQNGYRDALSSDENFLAGLNVCQGNVTYKAVADDLDYEFIDPSKAIN